MASAGPTSGSGSRSFPCADTTFTKLFVGGLAWETRSETMRRYFEQFGDIIEAVVITDKNTARSKGYGFVTFRDPESAKKACVDPTPIIDGRRANCNLASLGRPRPPPPFGRIKSASHYHQGGLAAASGPYGGEFGYQQPLSYGYQQGSTYSPYRYMAYGPEYNSPQAVYNPYIAQQYLQVYGVPGSVNLPTYPYNIGPYVPYSHGFTTSHGYPLPGHQTVQLGGPSVTAITTSPTPQPPYPTGARPSLPAQTQLLPPGSTQIIQGGGSEQNAL